jgi:hypothetical protein
MTPTATPASFARLLAELSFTQELVKTALGAAATALFAALVGGIALGQVTRRIESRREERELRRALLDRASRIAAKMFVTCQDVSRVRRGTKHGEVAAALDELDDVYKEFSVEAECLHNELGARFGFEHAALVDGVEPELGARERWHQISDVLTVYYFSLLDQVPESVPRRNSRGFEGRYHSGLDLVALHGGLGGAAARNALRRAYGDAVPKVAAAILTQPL